MTQSDDSREANQLPQLCSNHKVRRRKGGTYPLSHLYEHFGLVRLSRLGHDVSWTKACREPAHAGGGVEGLGDRHEGHAVLVEQLDQLGEVGERAGETVDLIDDHDADIAGPDIGEEIWIQPAHNQMWSQAT
jgi:hypothetical protein